MNTNIQCLGKSFIRVFVKIRSAGTQTFFTVFHWVFIRWKCSPHRPLVKPSSGTYK